jgi:hypothetical protein
MDNSTNREMEPLRCLQVNLQHKRAATNNLVQIMSDNQIDLAFVQEPYNTVYAIIWLEYLNHLELM